MKIVLLFLYIVVNVFLYILNFEVFNSQVDIDFGFGIFSTMPLILLQVVGFVFALLFFLTGQKADAKHALAIDKLEDKILILEKDIEISNLKAANAYEKIETENEIINQQIENEE